VETYLQHGVHIDLVILDMIMPAMGGGAVFDALKEIDPHVKVLLSSGYSAKGKARENIDRGCCGFIQKPFDVHTLSRILREILDPEQARP
jgi:two-component system, cell cycle sensor histidine kinase and response regulator CckA